MCAAWEQPSVASSGQIVSDSLEHCERGIRLDFLAAASRDGEIRSTPGTQARTILSTQWLHAVSSQRLGSFRIRGHPISRRFEHEPELLAEPVTIAREAAPAFELDGTVDTTLELDIIPDPLGPAVKLNGLRDLTR
jgi:hypothetical protein